MSVKLGHGFRLPEGSTIESLMPRIQELRSWAAEFQQEALLRHMATCAVDLYDRATLGEPVVGPRSGGGPLSYAWEEISRRLRELDGGPFRDPEVDYRLSFTLFPQGGSLYGLYYTEQGPMRAKLFETLSCVPFGYQNSTDDLPDGVTWEEYQKRGAFWDRLLRTPEGVSSLPTLTGIDVRITLARPLLPVITAETLPRYMPSFEVRVQKRARDTTLAAWWRLQKAKGAEAGTRLAIQGLHWMQDTPEGQSALEAEKIRVAEMLVTEPSFDDLKAPLPAPAEAPAASAEPPTAARTRRAR